MVAVVTLATGGVVSVVTGVEGGVEGGVVVLLD
jgi:hypothetical protein